MLKKASPQHHVTNAYAHPHATRNTGKHNAAHCEVFNQRSRGGGSGDLADSGKRQHHRLAFQESRVKIAPSMFDRAPLLEQVNKAGLLLGERTQDGKWRVRS